MVKTMADTDWKHFSTFKMQKNSAQEALPLDPSKVACMAPWTLVVVFFRKNHELLTVIPGYFILLYHMKFCTWNIADLWVCWNHFVRLSICSSVRVSDRVRSVSSERLNHFLPTCVWCCITMRLCIMQKNWFIIFNVKVTATAYIIIIWPFLLYLLTAGLFATKLGLIVEHQKLECPMEKWDYCVEGQGHSKGSKCLWMFVSMISESQNILLPNLVWLCSIISQSDMQKNWFTVFNVKVTVRVYIIKIWLQ